MFKYKFSLVLIIVWLINIHIAFAQAIDPILQVFSSEHNCEVKPSGLYTNCQSVTALLSLEQPSSTADPLIQTLRFSNVVQVGFRCPATRTFDSGIRLNGVSRLVKQTKLLEPQLEEFSVPYNNQEKYEFYVNAESFPTVAKDCNYSVYSQTTKLANIDTVEKYINLLLSNIQRGQQGIKKLDEAATLPAKWIVILGLGDSLETEISRLNLEVESKQKELQRLKDIPSDKKSAYEKDRLVELESEINTTVAQIESLKILKKSAISAIPDTQKCLTNNSDPDTEAYCLKKIEAIKQDTEKSFEEDISKAVGVSDFLKAEVARLQEREKDLTQRMNEIALRIRGSRGLERSVLCR